MTPYDASFDRCKLVRSSNGSKLAKVIKKRSAAEEWGGWSEHIRTVNAYCRYLYEKGVPYEIRKDHTGVYRVKGHTL